MLGQVSAFSPIDGFSLEQLSTEPNTLAEFGIAYASGSFGSGRLSSVAGRFTVDVFID
jgi:hypothetical protein